MSKEGYDNNDDFELFTYYLEHGYFPKKNKKKDFKPKKRQVEEELNKKEKKTPTDKEEQDLFLSYLNNQTYFYNKENYIKNSSKKNTKYSSKSIKVDDRLDLHGFTSTMALIHLKEFIIHSKRNHLKVLLIIHGKGIGSENGIAVLKDLVENYLENDGREYIKSYMEAPDSLGGSGAKIVYLK